MRRANESAAEIASDLTRPYKNGARTFTRANGVFYHGQEHAPLMWSGRQTFVL